MVLPLAGQAILVAGAMTMTHEKKFVEPWPTTVPRNGRHQQVSKRGAALHASGGHGSLALCPGAIRVPRGFVLFSFWPSQHIVRSLDLRLLGSFRWFGEGALHATH